MPEMRRQPAKCKTCDAEIYWAKTAQAKSMPVDAAPVADGGLVLDVDATTGDLKVSAYTEKLGKRRRFISHFVTCAQAAQHRKAR